MHGGSVPAVRRAARERLQRAKAERAVLTYGLPRDIDPYVALREEVARTAGAIDWLQSIVAQLDVDELGFSIDSVETVTRDTNGDPNAPACLEEKVTHVAKIFRAIEADTELALDERQREVYRTLAVNHLSKVGPSPCPS
jgi:hypothetical protein